MLPGRGAQVVAGWLRSHPGVEVVCRDGSTAYAQAVRDALPNVVQVADRGHLWYGLCDAVGKEVAAHSACWATATGLREGKLAETTLQRWQQIHALLEAGVGLLDCSRRLGLAMNTVKRYARAATPRRVQRVPKYRACMVDPYPDHLRARREQEPAWGPPRCWPRSAFIDAVAAAITLDHHNGRTEGVNTKTKLIKRQMYGRAGFALLRHRILLG